MRGARRRSSRRGTRPHLRPDVPPSRLSHLRELALLRAIKETVSGERNYTLVTPEEISDLDFPALHVEIDRLPRFQLNARCREAQTVLSVLCDVLGSSHEHSFQGTLTRRFYKCAVESGPEAALQYLATEASACRSKWILGKGSPAHAQISYVKRALPCATREMAQRALREHQENLMTPFVCDPLLLSGMRRSARRFAERNIRKEHGIISAGVPNHASCSEYTLKQGGFRRYVSEIAEHADVRRLVASLPGASELPVQDVSSLVRDASLQYTAYETVIGLGEKPMPPSVPHALLERGLKTRVITKSSGALLLLGHPVRRKLLKSIRRQPEFSAPFLGRVDEEVASRFSGAFCEVVLSTDLKNASDLLPHDLVAALVDGLEASKRFSAFEVNAMRAVLGPQQVRFPDGEVQTKRGILMGLPLTWIALSLIHRYWWDQAIRNSARKRRIQLKEVYEKNRFIICGDDALFVGEAAVAEEYHSLMARSGAAVSPGKHYVSDKAPYRGVFLERLYEFERGTDGRITLVTRDPSIPLRGLADPTGSGIVAEVLGKARPIKVPKALSQLIVISSVWKSHPRGEARLLSYVERNSHLRRVARSYGLQDGAPLDEGGSGLPLKQVSLKVAARRKVIQYLPRYARPNLPRLAAAAIDPLWSLAGQLAESDLSGFFADGTFIRSATVSAERGLLYLEDSEDPDGSFYRTVPMGYAKFADLAHVRMYEELASISGALHTKKVPSLRPREFTLKLSEYIDALPKVNVHSAAPFPLQFPSDELSVELTRLPNGSRVFPIWLGPKSATEATLRRTLYEALLGLQHLAVLQPPQGG